MSAYAPRDTQANRLILIGCGLLLVPCLLLVLSVGVLGWPLLLSMVPRVQHPVVAAQPGETLVIVTGLEGTTGTDPTDDIFRALADVSQNMGYRGSALPRIRISRLADTPVSEQDILSLGHDYNASIILWGQYNASAEYQVTCSILHPTADLEPGQFTITLSRGDATALDDLAKLVFAIELYHTGDNYSADMLLGSLGSNLDPIIVTLYQVEVARVLGDLAGAELSVNTALSSAPDNPLLLATKAVVLGDLARYEEALEAASASLKQDPDGAEVYLIRGAIYLRIGNAENALADASHALELEPGNSAALHARAQAYEILGDIQAAISDYTVLIKREPDNYQYFLERAHLYTANGDGQKALADFERALTLADEAMIPDLARQQVLEARALAYRDFGQYNLALSDYDSLGRMGLESFQYLLERGMTYWEMGDKEQAEREWSSFMELSSYSQDASGYNNLAWSLAMAGYYEPALEYSNQSLTLDPLDGHSLHTRGYIHLGLKQYQAALDDFERALEADTNLGYPPIYRDMADAHFGLGHYEQAIRNYRTYLNLMPDIKDLYEVQQRIKAAGEAASNR